MVAAKTEDVQRNDEINSSNGDDSTDEFDARHQVFFNDLIMRKVVSFVNDVKDRRNLELSNTFMNELCSYVPYISCGKDNSIIDMYFTALEPIMNVSIAGNNFKVQALTASFRPTYARNHDSQPITCILKLKHIIKRFSRQIYRLHVGGIPDFERRIGYIPNHRLLLTRDMCDEFDKMKNVHSLVLRDLCLMSSVIEYWSSTECVLTNRISSLCLHTISFNRMEDMDNFVSIISGSVTKLYLSNCDSETIMKIGRWLRTHPNKLEVLYIAINQYTFDSEEEVQQMFEEVSDLANKLFICTCFSRFLYQPSVRIFVSIFVLLPDIQQITAMELDLGPLVKDSSACSQFFAGLPRMKQLRVLRLFGCSNDLGFEGCWSAMLQCFSRLSQITELCVTTLTRNMRMHDLKDLCGSLPTNLCTLVLHDVRQLQNDHLSLIAQRCPRLNTLYMRDLRSITSNGIVKALLEFRMLSQIALCHSGPVTQEAFELLANREVMPHIEAVIMGGNRNYHRVVVPDALLRRLPQYCLKIASYRWRDCEYHLWRNRKAYEQLLNASRCTDCPGCGKDVSLIGGGNGLAID